LFAGCKDAAQRAAMIYSLFATCRYHQIKPNNWLKDVLEQLHLYNTNNTADLLAQSRKKSSSQPGLVGGLLCIAINMF